MLLAAAFVLDFGIGALFLTAFYWKAADYRNFKLTVQSYRVIPVSLIAPAVIGLLALELVLFVSFASGSFMYDKEIAAIALLVGFSFMLLRKRSLEKDSGSACSCFGSLHVLNRYPLTRNGILIGLCVVKMTWLASASAGEASLRQLLFCTLAALGCLLAFDYERTRKRYYALKLVS